MALLNGGFESWTLGVPDNWTPNLGAGSTLTQELSIVHSGSSSVKLTRTVNISELAQTTSCTAGLPCVLNYWQYAAPGEFPFVRINVNGGPSNGFWAQLTGALNWAAGFDQWSNTNGTSSWQNLNFNIAAIPAGATTVTIDMGLSVLGYFDDFTFTQSGSSRNLLLTGVGS